MQLGPHPTYPDDAEAPEGVPAREFHIQAASEIRAAGNALFQKVGREHHLVAELLGLPVMMAVTFAI